MAAECPEHETADIESELAGLREQIASTTALLEEEPAPAAPDVLPPPARPRLPGDPGERVQAAECLRTQGNTKFQAGDIAAARKEYEEALRHLGVGAGYGRDPNIDADSKLAERSKACRIPVQLNLALCCLRIEPCEAFRTLELCESVLEEEPENPKATYRKAKALLELGELKEAEWELVRACKLMPKDATVRNDLEALRRRVRESKEQERRTFEGFLDRGPGFASDGRADAAASDASARGEAGTAVKGYELICNPEQNPYVSSEQPGVSGELMAQGKLEEAVWALEAALMRTAACGEWNAHFETFLELGRFFMDLNIDRLAILCINHIIQGRPLIESPGAAGVSPVLPVLRRHALLLSGICLLNEAEADPQVEVSQAIEVWLKEASSIVVHTISEASSLDTKLETLRCAPQVAADAAVAHGLLHLVHGSADIALQDFAGALRAPEDESCFFGSPRRLSTKWNMLGAVLANRGRHEHALLAYERALRLQPHYPRALNNRGIAFQARAAHTEAAAAFAGALAVVPQWCWPALWPQLTQVAEQSANVELAEAAGEKNLSKVQQLLGPASSVAPEAAEDAVDRVAVLERIGL